MCLHWLDTRLPDDWTVPSEQTGSLPLPLPGRALLRRTDLQFNPTARSWRLGAIRCKKASAVPIMASCWRGTWANRNCVKTFADRFWRVPAHPLDAVGEKELFVLLCPP